MTKEILNNKHNSILVVIDGSYFLYFLCFAAISEYQKKCSLESKLLIKDAELTDQEHLPDLLVSEDFRRILKNMTMKKCETIDWYLKNTFQEEIDYAESIDFIFAQDDFLKNNFRKQIYPEYKAQRKLVKKSFDMFKIHSYVLNVLFKELEIENKYGYRLLKMNGAEGDDIIATVIKNFSKEYMKTILFASDRDFVQLKNVYQMTLFGKEVECKVADEEVSKDEYLLTKILLGDSADNIGKVFDRVGPKKALKLVRDKETLKQKLNENQDSAKQFLLNKNLISFDFIPQELNDKIVEQANKLLYADKPINDELDFKNFMTL